MATWFTILASWPAPGSPMRVTALAKFIATGFISSKAAASPPHITVSAPFTAPAWPPDTGASTKCRPRAFAAAKSSRATSADGGGVVDEHGARRHAGEGAIGAQA